MMDLPEITPERVRAFVWDMPQDGTWFDMAPGLGEFGFLSLFLASRGRGHAITDAEFVRFPGGTVYRIPDWYRDFEAPYRAARTEHVLVRPRRLLDRLSSFVGKEKV